MIKAMTEIEEFYNECIKPPGSPDWKNLESGTIVKFSMFSFWWFLLRKRCQIKIKIK
jgi:hypothetical protein